MTTSIRIKCASSRCVGMHGRVRHRSVTRERTNRTVHGGELAGSSDGLGTGCTFPITLPRAQTMVLTASDEGADPAPLRRRRVLVADDNRDGADSLGLLLSLQGHEVHVAYTGGEAVALAVAQ